MILELRKSCLEAIERALININQVRTQWASGFPKPAQQKLHSVQNDIQLLKDNFTLIATKVVRLQSKCSEKESMAVKAQHKYRMKFEQACESYKILEVKHQKLGKQLNFIKFSNNCLRNQLQSIQSKQYLNQKLSKAIIEISGLISTNGQNLQNNINKIIASIEKQLDPGPSIYQKPVLVDISKANQDNLGATHRRVGSACQFSLQPPPIFQQPILKQQKLIVNSCDFKNQRDHLKTKKKNQLNKQTQQLNQAVSSDKKKKSQLAKLIDQQSRLARINQRYLSTDIY